ncbi:4'-phosphopantetheinyl transferase superfamily protein [Pelagibius sp. 7325]|uniref:4'-phosphopantetheinyl transferase family protein n=1 Tax=Pelagibius sp. 7325 TaxID=3131994 RepID=UPI0030EDDE91
MTELHLWCLPEAGAELGRIAALAETRLSNEERQRHQGMSAEGRARRFLLGRLLLREALGHHLTRDPSELVFGETANGKLYLVSPGSTGWDFCLSHSRHESIVALARSKGVGVDLEDVARGATVLKIARKLYPAEERRQLEAQAEEVAADTALALWTLKESIAKALGQTIWQAVGEISLNFAGTDLSWRSHPSEKSAAEWALLAGRFRRHHRFAVALCGTSRGRGDLVVRAHQLGLGKPAADTFEVTTVALPSMCHNFKVAAV